MIKICTLINDLFELIDNQCTFVSVNSIAGKLFEKGKFVMKKEKVLLSTFFIV